MVERSPGSVRSLIGRVVSNKMHKSVVVLVERKVKHPKYGKYLRRSTRLHVHDEENVCQVGDVVEIFQCCPVSKTKSWRLLRVMTPLVS
jgi:small subunit ribosomal protein S17